MSQREFYDKVPLRTSATIRVLYLDPDNPGVVGQLRTVNLAESPRFATLSYVWGDIKDPKVTFVCDGYEILVTESCLSALRHLRADLLKEDLPIWIDAICIDQESDTEKSTQLPLMGRIYAEATKGYIWLGTGTPDTDSAMDYLAKSALPFQGPIGRTGFQMLSQYWRILQLACHFFLLSAGRFSIWQFLYGSVPSSVGSSLMVTLGSLGSPREQDIYSSTAIWGRTIIFLFNKAFLKVELPFSSAAVITMVDTAWCVTRLIRDYPSKGLGDIFSHPWIERIWTLQEAVLSENSVLVCGNKFVSWESMIYAIEHIAFVDSKKLSEGLKFPSSYHNWRRLQLFWLNSQQIHTEAATHRASLYLRLRSYRESANKAWRLSLMMSLTYHLYLLVIKYLLCNLIPIALRVPIFVLVAYFNIRNYREISTYREAVEEHTEETYDNKRSLPYEVSEAVLVEIQSRKSQKAEDKYFGVLGLIGGSQVDIKYTDSKQSLSLIYQRLFITLLEYTGSLNILLFTSPHTEFNGSPSWVVNWADAPRCWIRARYHFKVLNGFVSRRFPQIELHEYTGASLQSKPEYRFDGQKLIVRGRMIGYVAITGTEFEELHESSHDVDLLLNLIFFQMIMGSLILDGSSPLIREMTTLALARFFEACSDRFQDRPSSDEWQQIICQSPSHDVEVVREQLKKHEDRTGTSSPALAWRYHVAITNFLAKEKMVLVTLLLVNFYLNSPTAALRSGCAPAGVKKKDKVALISGVSTPMILREHAGCYQVIGPIFVPGAMDGEWWDECELDELVLV